MTIGADAELAADDKASATVSAATAAAAAAAVPSRHFPAVGCTVWALLVLAGSAGCAADLHRRPGRFDLAELRRNIVEGLQLDRIPDMTKVDISNDEFHCKYLEYFRRLYADESESHDNDDDATMSAAAGYDNDDDNDDVSAIQVRGRMKHYGDNGDEESPGPPTDDGGNNSDVVLAKITFPIDRAMMRGGGSNRVTVIKSVVRIYGHAKGNVTHVGGHVRIRVYGHLTYPVGGVPSSREKSSYVGDLLLPLDGGSGRWSDVDVTRLLRLRKRHRETGGNVTMELTLRSDPETARFGSETNATDNGDRLPVLHAFLDGGSLRSTDADSNIAVRCAGSQTIRKKRAVDDGAESTKRHRRRRRRRRRPISSSSVRRTDCKTDATTAGNGNNGTEHGVTAGGNKCCREEMRVVFAEIPGFDFIIEPKSFDAGLCRGRCPAKYNPATRHAFIQSLLWKEHNRNNNNGNDDRKRGQRKVRHGGGNLDAAARTPSKPAPPPKPCCAPSKLDRLQILIIDDTKPNSLKVTTWKEMAVIECACS